VGEPGWLARSLERERLKKAKMREQRAYKALAKDTLSLLSKREIEATARECGFYKQDPKEITAFDFVMCCAMASLTEAKRGFATVWRLLSAAAGVDVARSAVTQRFGEGSAKLMQAAFTKAVERLPSSPCPDLLGRLERFESVLADDGSVIMLSPLLKKLFPATRTKSVDAAGKVHATADLLRRRITRVEITGERDSELEVSRSRPIEAGTLYMSDLGYTCYDYFADISGAGADLLWRLKKNANPKIVAVRHGIYAPASVVKRELGLNSEELRFTQDTFDVDAEFPTSDGSVVLRVVGQYDAETKTYHCYVTTLSSDEFTPEDLAALYCLRWVIELLFKLLKSSCHLDHVDTSNPHALRTHIYASLLAATILSSMCHAASSVYGIPGYAISALTVGIAAPLIALPLLFLWNSTDLTPQKLAEMILRVLAVGCRDQNPKRTRAKWGVLAV
jgi:putative transposase